MRILGHLVCTVQLLWWACATLVGAAPAAATAPPQATTEPAPNVEKAENIFEKDLGRGTLFRVEKRPAIVPPPPIVIGSVGPLLPTQGFLYTFILIEAHNAPREVLRLGPTDYFAVNLYDAALVQNTLVVLYHAGPSTFARAMDLSEGPNPLNESLIEAAHDYGALPTVTVGAKVIDSGSQDDITIAIEKDTGAPRPVYNYFHVLRGQSSFTWEPTGEPSPPTTQPAAPPRGK